MSTAPALPRKRPTPAWTPSPSLHLVIVNPAPNYAVVAGPITDNCAQYAETVVAQ